MTIPLDAAMLAFSETILVLLYGKTRTELSYRFRAAISNARSPAPF